MLSSRRRKRESRRNFCRAYRKTKLQNLKSQSTRRKAAEDAESVADSQCFSLRSSRDLRVLCDSRFPRCPLRSLRTVYPMRLSESAISRHEVEAPGRAELPTRGLGNRCSIHLSYGASHRNWRAHSSLLFSFGDRNTEL